MAISLKEVEKKTDERDSLLEMILARKERKYAFKNKSKANVRRPWDHKARETKGSVLNQPFNKKSSNELEVGQEISKKASGIFSNLDLTDL